MKKGILLFILVLAGLMPLTASFEDIPVYFIPNKGQVDPQVKFYTNRPGYTLWLTETALIFDRYYQSNGNPENSVRELTQLKLIETYLHPEIIPLNLTGHKVNYIKRKNKGHQITRYTELETTHGVLYKNIYPNIDLKVYGRDQQVEYDWIVHPGGDPNLISFQYSAPDCQAKVAPNGSLSLEPLSGKIQQQKPEAFQFSPDGKQPVSVEYKKVNTEKNSESTFCFNVGPYDKTAPLVIDPVILNYSTYLGVNADTSPASGMAVDEEGNVYVVGSVSGTEFPTIKPFQEANNGEQDIFISKLAAGGSRLIYSTFLGGSSDDKGLDIAVAPDGSACITGYTRSSDFPLENAFRSSLSGEVDAIVAKFSPDGTSLIFSTYLGGSNNDRGRCIEVNSAEKIYVAGDTSSGDFPTKNAYRPNFGGSMDVFVTKFTAEGTALVYSTYLGGSGTSRVAGIALHSTGCLYVTGTTGAENFPSVGAYQRSFGGGSTDAFITKFAANGSSLLYSTYLGGKDADESKGIAVDPDGGAYITGDTYSNNFPIQSAFQSALRGDKDAFVSRLSTGGNSLVYSTYLGGLDTQENAMAIAVNDSGNAYVTGFTSADDFPVVTPYQQMIAGGSDVFITRMSTDGTTLEMSTFFGGRSSDIPSTIILKNHDVYVAGYTTSTNFPVKMPFQGTYNGSSDPFGYAAFITKFRYIKPLPPAPPFGVLEVPISGSAVSGSIIVSGWALDNAEIPAVRIYINNPTGPGLIYIGEGLFVEGARPDVRAEYSDYPFNDQSGWGYMMLTNFLPNGGNGNYTIHAIATDTDGNEITLGTTVIHCDNDNAVKPFGAIDFPAPGEIVSGTYTNIGWALTPMPNQIPEDGSTINVFIDGIPVGKPTYNLFRSDIAQLFPGYANSNGSKGVFTFDSRKFTNGIHSIAWSVKDDAGNVEGIGSRYFFIQN